MSIDDNGYGAIDRIKDNAYAARMGRPAIGKFTAVRLAPETLARIDAIVASGRRADFIRAAVEGELTRREAVASPHNARRDGQRPDPAALYAALSGRRSTRP